MRPIRRRRGGAETIDGSDQELFEAAGLYDAGRVDADERLALLRFLREQGVTIEEMVDADREEWLPYVAFSHAVREGTEPMTLTEAAARAGASRDEVLDLWRAAGFRQPEPEAAAFSQAYVEAFQVFKAAEVLMGHETVLELVRVMGSAMSRIAEAELSAFAKKVGAPLLESEGEVGVARANVQIAALMPHVARALGAFHLDHIDAGLRRLGQTVEAVRAGAETAALAVGFIDLVGFTSLSQRASRKELGTLVDEFEAEAGEVIAARGGRLVKMIGDEAMFVAPDPAAACDVALTLRDRFGSRSGFPELRGGLTFGDALTRHGDYYGPVVNLASRLVGAADPGVILVDQGLRESVVRGRGEYGFVPSGTRALKGYVEPVAVFSLARSS